jgi:DNA-binding transcriptional MerR regulator
MPKPRPALNGFTAAEVSALSGLSRPMIEYLNRHDYLRPAYAPEGNPRGRVRYYSYRDLVVARLIQLLRQGGIQLARVRAAAQQLSEDRFWSGDEEPSRGREWLVSDGRVVELRDGRTILERLRHGRPASFAFVAHLGHLRDEVRARVPAEKRTGFSMAVKALAFADTNPAKAHAHG